MKSDQIQVKHFSVSESVSYQRLSSYHGWDVKKKTIKKTQALFWLDHQIKAIVIWKFLEVLVSSMFCALLNCWVSKPCYNSGAGLLHEGEVIYKLCFTVVTSVSDTSIE